MRRGSAQHAHHANAGTRRIDRIGLFKVVPRSVIVLPVLFENQVKAVIELATVTSFTGLQVTFLEQLTASASC